MGQRLGNAGALLGDPAVVMLDGPVNGLDPEGVRWIRHLLQDLAAEGRTVFVSSHLMNEMAVTAEHLVIGGRGRFIADVSLAEFTPRSARNAVLVRTDRRTELRALLVGDGGSIFENGYSAMEVTGMTPYDIGEKAALANIPVHELTPVRASLEDAFMELTGDSVQYHGTSTHGPSTDNAQEQAA